MSMFGREIRHISFRNILTKSVLQKSSLLPDLKITRCLTEVMPVVTSYEKHVKVQLNKYVNRKADTFC